MPSGIMATIQQYSASTSRKCVSDNAESIPVVFVCLSPVTLSSSPPVCHQRNLISCRVMSTLHLERENGEVFDFIGSSSDDTRHSHQEAVFRYSLNENVFVASLNSMGFGEDATKQVVVKLARGPDEMKALKHEYWIYSEKLAHLQGSVIPECMGFFTGSMPSNNDTSCMILEYCVPVLTEPLEEDKYRQQIMSGISKIHQAGILHNNLLARPAHIVTQGSGPRIVDFSIASLHQCENEAEIQGDWSPGQLLCCSKAYYLEITYGKKKEVPARIYQPVIPKIVE